MRWLGVLKVAIVLASGFVVLGHAPGAWACSCIGYTNERDAKDAAYANAKLVFTGKALSREDPRASEPIKSSGDPIIYRFDVESSQKGTAGDSILVRSVRDGASCGFTFTVGRRYQVFANPSVNGYSTGLCSGTHELAASDIPTAIEAGQRRFSPMLPLALLSAGAVMLALAWRFQPRAG